MTELDDKTALTSGWPDGWYVYENGKVDGPYSAEATFKLAGEAPDGKSRLVSRKGFTQWYALKDLSEIFKMTDQLGKKAQQQLEWTEAQLAAARAALTAPEKAAVSKKQIRPETRRDAVKPVFSGAATDPVKPPAIKELSAPPVSLTPATELKAPRLAAGSAKATTKSLMMQEYFLARGRLRLGRLRNPWITAFVGFPLTAGVLWGLWIRDLSREVVFHARNSDRSPLPPWGLALVPVGHLYVVYKLAQLIVEMEGQNRYRSVSPFLATLFALFPPLAMAYLQDAANRHWMLHVKHTVVKKRADGAGATGRSEATAGE